jgi:hypothetical protein
MHLLQKRIMYLNSDDALKDSNDTRGDLYIPVSQQLPDPAATDLVFKMYIQDAVIVNDNININADNARFKVTVTVYNPIGEFVEVASREYTFPSLQMSEIDFVEQWNSVFGSGNLIQVEAQTANPSFEDFESFRLEWTAAAYENDRYSNGYRPAIERESEEQKTYPAFMPLGDKLMCIVRDVRMTQTGTEATRVAWIVGHMKVNVEALNPAGGRLLGMQPDQQGENSVAVLTPFWAAQYPSPTEVTDNDGAGSFTGTRIDSSGDPFGAYNMPANESFTGKMRDGIAGEDVDYPDYETARAASAMPYEILMDDFTQLHINTDLPVQNSEIKPQEGLCQSRITALVPVGVPHGATIYYQDTNGINAAYERNQSTLSRLHIWLTDKYGKPYTPASPWSFSFALEIWQDDFKRMLDVLLASQSLHESAVKLHKLGLVGASFQALEG